MSKITKFYGRVNDQEFDNVNDYNKAITQAINADEFRSATSNTWVEMLEETLEEPENTSLISILENFKNSHHKDLKTAFANLKEDIISYLEIAKQEDLPDDLAFLTAEKQELYNTLEKVEKEYKHNCSELTKAQEQLNAQQAKVESLEKTCKTQGELLEPWSDFYEYLDDTIQQVQDWIKEESQQNHCECEDCECLKNMKKPSWMDVNQFNFLKEVFG
jgi:chromosome segregation ATPase